jgi:hypothetical protein
MQTGRRATVMNDRPGVNSDVRAMASASRQLTEKKLPCVSDDPSGTLNRILILLHNNHRCINAMHRFFVGSSLVTP